MLCATAFGQSGPKGSPDTIPRSESAAPFEPQFNFDVSGLANSATTNQTLSPCPDASSACPKRFWFDRKALGNLPVPPGIDFEKQRPSDSDSLMVIHPPQSAMGNLPSKPVLPHIYPHLKMLFIHGAKSPAGPALSREAPTAQRFR